MFAKTFGSLSLLVSVAIQPGVMAPEIDDTTRMTAQEKSAVMRPLVRTATECVAHTVAADPRFGKADVTDLIVDAFKSCVDPVRALIDAHDRYYGAGTGEEFFMGPYLDALPAAVTGIVGGEAR